MDETARIEALIELHRVEAARAALGVFVAGHPEEPEGARLEYLIAAEDDDSAAKARAAQRWLALDPENPYAQVTCAFHLNQHRRTQKAAAAMARNAAAHAPDSAVVVCEAAWVLVGHPRHRREAYTMLNSYAASHPASPDYLEGRLRVLMRDTLTKARRNEMDSLSTQLLAIQPDNVDYLELRRAVDLLHMNVAQSLASGWAANALDPSGIEPLRLGAPLDLLTWIPAIFVGFILSCIELGSVSFKAWPLLAFTLGAVIVGFILLGARLPAIHRVSTGMWALAIREFDRMGPGAWVAPLLMPAFVTIFAIHATLPVGQFPQLGAVTCVMALTATCQAGELKWRRPWLHLSDVRKGSVDPTAVSWSSIALRFALGVAGWSGLGVLFAPGSPIWSQAIAYTISCVWAGLVIFVSPLEWLIRHRPSGRSIRPDTSRLTLLLLAALPVPMLIVGALLPLPVWFFIGGAGWSLLIAGASLLIRRGARHAAAVGF